MAVNVSQLVSSGAIKLLDTTGEDYNYHEESLPDPLLKMSNDMQSGNPDISASSGP
jgi:hypothetical protein